MIPEQFRFLVAEPGPKMLTEALKLVGIREIPGPKSEAKIMAMAKFLGIDKIYKNDDTAWCGLAMGYIIVKAGKPLPLKDYDILRALRYMNYGEPVNTPMLADVLVFDRTGGGHVALYVGETSRTYWCLGGNQGNMFGFAELPKNRLRGARRFYINQPENVRRIILPSSGVISRNEA